MSNAAENCQCRDIYLNFISLTHALKRLILHSCAQTVERNHFVCPSPRFKLPVVHQSD